MKKLIALLLVLTMCFGLFAGCGPAKEPVENPTEPSNNEPTPDVPEVTEDKNLEKAVEYLRVYYKDVAEKTPADYKRLAAVRIGTTSYPITWTTDASSDLITIVDNGDGTVTIDINEDNNTKQEADLNYTLTATLTGLDGREATYSWNHILPVGMDYKGIVDAAYELEKGEALEGTFTLVGVIDSIDTMYSSDYKNITVTILVEGREDKPIMCYRLKGEGCDKLAVGDTITVTGVLKNYNGTIEFDAGCILEAVVPGGLAPVEAPTDPVEILKAAFALAPGKSLPYEATLTGKVVQINTPYDSGYGNISVTISTNGYRLLCYRLKGSGADQVNVNDVITVRGQITNYYNVNDGSCTVEFNYPTLVGLTNYAPPAGLTDPTEIINAAYGLAEGASLPYEASLTGVVTKINTPYDSGYGNITVTIAVPGNESRPIKCYRLKGSGVSGLEVGDTVTVTGYLKNYYGTIEFDAGCRASNIVKAPDPAEEAAKILNALYALQPGESLEGEYSLTGKITEIGSPYSEQYGNITVTIVVEGHEDKPVVAFRMTGEGADTLALGDTITVTGGLTNYNGTYEFTAGCTFELVSKAEPEIPDIPVEPYGTAEVITELPVAGDLVVIYNSGNAMTSTADGNKLAGEAAEIVEGVLELTETMAQLTVAIDENGYYTFTVGGKYLTSGETGNKLFLADEASDYSLWTVEAATEETFYIKNVNAKYVNAEGVATYQSLEFYSGFTTYGHKETEVYQMTVLKVIEEEAPVAPIADGDQVVIYAPAYNKALSVTKTGYYNVGVDVTVTDGVLTGFGETEIFTVIVNEDGTYSFANGEQNIGLADQFASMDLGAVNDDWTLVDLGEGLYLIQNVVRGSYMEWYDSKNNWSTYASETAATDGQFQMAFYVIPSEDDEPVVPETLAEQIAEAQKLENKAYLPYESTITGTIVGEVQPSTKNEGQFKFTVVDEAGNSLLCYYVPVTNGTPVEGDTITVTGYLTAYNGSAQFDSTASATLAEKEEPEIPDEPVQGTATITFDDVANRTECTGEKQVWVQNGITVVNEKWESTAEIKDYSNPVRFYSKTRVSIAYPGMQQITVNCSEAKYADALMNGLADAGLAGKANGAVVVITLEAPSDEIAIVMNGQVRVVSIEVSTTVSGETPEEPEVPEEPVVPETLAEQIVEAQKLANGAYLPYESTITGVIVGEVQPSSYNETQFKFTVVDEAGNSLLCYFVPVANGTPVEGDTITVTGKLTAYKGSAQFDSTASATLAEKVEEPEVPETYMNGPFLMGLYQGNLEKDLFFTGEMDGYYLATSENVEDCMPVYLAYTGEQVQIVFFDEAGVMNYVEIQKVGNYVNTVITTQPTMYYTENYDYGTLVANVEGTDYYLGTYKTYTTISASKLSYITGEGNFPIQFTETVQYSYPMQLVMEQAKLGKTLYFTGEAAGDYLATSEDPADAVDVMLIENYTGEAAIAFATEDGTAKFIEIYLNDAGKPRVRITDLPESFYTYNEELDLYVTELEGKEYYLGTYGDYTTIGASSTYYITGDNAANVGVSQYVATLEWPAEEEEPSEPEVDPNSPAAILEAAYALAEGESMDHAVELAGEIISVDTEYSEQYGNITVTIAVEGYEDKPVKCFRLKGEGVADLKVGDFILVSGTIMNYKGTVEFGAGCELLSKQVAPETAPEVAPEETPEVAPEENPGDDFVYIPDEETPEVAPEETPEVAPEVTPEVAPEETPAEETTEEVTEETVEEPVEDETVVTE